MSGETFRRKFSTVAHGGFNSLLPGARIRDCEGDTWFKTSDGSWVCEADPIEYSPGDLLSVYGPVIRIRAKRAKRPTT